MGKRKGVDPIYKHEIYKHFKKLYMNVFKWTGLPDTIRSEYIEQVLFENGNIVLFKDSVLGVTLMLPATYEGTLDPTGESLNIRISTKGGYNKRVLNGLNLYNIIKGDDVNTGLMCFDSIKGSVPAVRVRNIADNIYETEFSASVNVYAQRTPISLEVEHGQELYAKNLYMDYEGGAPVIFTRKKKNMTGVEEKKVNVLKTDAPVVFDKLHDHGRKLTNDVLSFTGIESNFGEKKERVNEQETLLSNGMSVASRQSRESAREVFLERAKKMFPDEFANVEFEVNSIALMQLDNFGENENVEQEEGEEIVISEDNGNNS